MTLLNAIQVPGVPRFPDWRKFSVVWAPTLKLDQ